jgi:hypothetical protein
MLISLLHQSKILGQTLEIYQDQLSRWSLRVQTNLGHIRGCLNTLHQSRLTLAFNRKHRAGISGVALLVTGEEVQQAARHVIIVVLERFEGWRAYSKVNVILIPSA